MNARTNNLAWRLVASMCLFAGLATTAARGEGSITFNGTSSPSGGTSKLENDSADLLDGSDTMSITAWVKAAGQGEGGFGQVVRLGATEQVALQHGSSPNLYQFTAEWSSTPFTHWQFFATDNSWNCLQVTYDKSDPAFDPEIYVNGEKLSEQEIIAPSGTPPAVGAGYVVGNEGGQSFTFDGQIGHVQIHNRILSKAELDACRQAPGSVVKGLRVWLPMPNASDTNDRSGNGFHGTATALTTGTAGPVLSLPSDMLSGNRILPAGITAVAQHIIPRYANGTDHPGGELRGWGPKSIIAATQETDNQDNKAIVVTEGNHVDPPEDISEWQNGSVPAMGNYGADPAVLQPALADCTIMGYIANYDWTQEGDVNDVPRVHNQMDDDLYDGFDFYGNGGTVRNVGVFGIPGTAGIVSRRGSARAGFQLEHDRLRWHLDHLYARRCYRGFFLNATDMYAGHIEVEAVRDWGVRIGSSVQFGTIHVYGCGYPEADGGGAAVWITGQQNMGGPLYVENATVGLNDSGQHTVINGITSHTCDDFNVILKGHACKLNSIDLRRCEVNLRFEGDQNFVSTGKIQLAESGVGIQYEDGTGPNDDSASSFNNVRDVLIDGYGDKDGDGDVNIGGGATDEDDADGAIGIDVNTELRGDRRITSLN